MHKNYTYVTSMLNNDKNHASANLQPQLPLLKGPYSESYLGRNLDSSPVSAFGF